MFLDRATEAQQGFGLLNELMFFKVSENCCFSVLVFGPESASYERSRGIRRWIFREISARAFFDSPNNHQIHFFSVFMEKLDFQMFR